MMKVCSKCKEEKSLDSFGNNSSSKDGLSYWCKTCARAAVKKSSGTTQGRAKKKIREKRYNSKADVRSKRREAVKRYYSSNPKAKLAHAAVNRALRGGVLVRLPCEECGSLLTEAHHDDYDLPLKVRWLCKLHHDEFHASNQEQK